VFSGIIEATANIEKISEKNDQLVIWVQKPNTFDDLKVGDSISVDGICLTVEAFDSQQIQFTVGYETLQVTGWSSKDLMHKTVNLERALAVSGRLHGHWVTGHVDAVSNIVSADYIGDNLILKIKMLDDFKRLIWKKGSVTLSGVSLTVNEVTGDWFSVCLIPETLRVTNLHSVKPEQNINVEFDYMARAVVNFLENSEIQNLKEIFKGDLDITGKDSYA